MYWIRTLLVVLGSVSTLYNAFAQDKLLLTNGRVKDLDGVVVHHDYTAVFYQRVEERVKEEEDLQRIDSTFKGHIWELYGDFKTASTAEENFAEEIVEKMAELTEEEFEEWKTKRYLELKEQEVSGTYKTSRKSQRMLRRYTKEIRYERVFSILRPDGSEEIIYTPDTLGLLAIDPEDELDYSVAEMRAYKQGRRDGRKHSMHDLGVGAGIGYISGLVGTAVGGAFYTPAVPGAAMVIMALSNVKIPKENLANWSGDELEAYKDGYERSAKNRKLLGLGIGSAVGLAVGISVGILERPYLK